MLAPELGAINLTGTQRKPQLPFCVCLLAPEAPGSSGYESGQFSATSLMYLTSTHPSLPPSPHSSPLRGEGSKMSTYQSRYFDLSTASSGLLE